MTISERRRSQRTKIDEIVYVDMGPHNGGVVLNVSEGGLAFCAAIPMARIEAIQFSLLVKGKGRVDGAGGLAWRDEAGKRCGVRFISKSGDIGERVRGWAVPGYSETLNLDETPSSAPSPDQAPDANAVEQISPLSLRNEVCIPTPISVSSKSERGPFDALTAEDLAALPHRTLPGIGTVLGAMAVALIISAFGLGAHFYGTGAMDTRAESSARTTATANFQGGAEQTVASPQEGGQAELAGALVYLRVPNGQRDTSAAMRLLRAAVKGGNSTAEVVLAEMYVNGDGVHKSCGQARGMLAAASKTGNVEAKAKLNELDARGCR